MDVSEKLIGLALRTPTYVQHHNASLALVVDEELSKGATSGLLIYDN